MLNLCVQNLYKNQTHVINVIKSSFRNLIIITMFESFLNSMENFMNNVMA